MSGNDRSRSPEVTGAAPRTPPPRRLRGKRSREQIGSSQESFSKSDLTQEAQDEYSILAACVNDGNDWQLGGALAQAPPPNASPFRSSPSLPLGASQEFGLPRRADARLSNTPTLSRPGMATPFVGEGPNTRSTGWFEQSSSSSSSRGSGEDSPGLEESVLRYLERGRQLAPSDVEKPEGTGDAVVPAEVEDDTLPIEEGKVVHLT